jgi:enoyl-CoA hydratase/carnithine racemase
MDKNPGRVLVERDGSIGRVIFDHPERHNAMTLEMWRQLHAAAESLDSDPMIRVIILAGAGGKAFVSGGDISEFDKTRSNAKEAESYAQIPGGARARLSACLTPVIAEIDGYCLGGGLAIALLADIRIASDRAVFGIPAAKIGLAYGFEGVRNLINAVGKSSAADILLSARRLDAGEALAMRLVNQVVSARELPDVVAERAMLVARNAPLSQAATKLTIAAAVSDPDRRDMQALDDIQRRCMDSADYAEGRLAFKEKRPPNFRGL